MNELLSEPQKRAIAQALHSLEVARQIIDAAQGAGLECPEHDARCEHMRKTLGQYQQVFGRAKKAKD